MWIPSAVMSPHHRANASDSACRRTSQIEAYPLSFVEQYPSLSVLIKGDQLGICHACELQRCLQALADVSSEVSFRDRELANIRQIALEVPPEAWSAFFRSTARSKAGLNSSKLTSPSSETRCQRISRVLSFAAFSRHSPRSFFIGMNTSSMN